MCDIYGADEKRLEGIYTNVESLNFEDTKWDGRKFECSLTFSQIKNLETFIETDLITYIHDMSDMGELDNINYIGDMIDAYRALQNAHRLAQKKIAELNKENLCMEDGM